MSLFNPSPSPRLLLGSNGSWPWRQRFYLDRAGIATHKHVIGKSGRGKSKLLENMAVEYIMQGIPIALIDPHSDLADAVLGSLNDRGFFDNPLNARKLLYVDFSRQDRYLPFNVLRQPYADDEIAENLTEVCLRAWPSLDGGSAPTFENLIRHATMVLLANHLPFTELASVLLDKSYRTALLRNVTDPQVIRFFTKRMEFWGREEAVMKESTLNRADLLTFQRTMRYSIGQHENALDFRHLLQGQVSAIFDVGGVPAQTQRFLGAFISHGLETAAHARRGLPQWERYLYILFLDEFSRFSAQSEAALEDMLSQTRKYNFFLVMAHQTFSQASERLRGALQNADEIAFRLGLLDADLMARQLSEYDPLSIKHEVADDSAIDRTHPLFWGVPESVERQAVELTKLKKQEFLIKNDDGVFRLRAPTVPAVKTSPERLREIKESFAQEYMRPREDVVPMVDKQILSSTATPAPTLRRKGSIFE